jgi:transposase-like protein
MVFWDTFNNQVVASRFTNKESYLNTFSWFKYLKNQGLMPKVITMDGHTQVAKAVRQVWPECLIQRCLYHIQRQSEMWLRRFPKTKLAFDLKQLVYKLTVIENVKQKELWWQKYLSWKEQYFDLIRQLNPKHRVESDVIKTYKMIEHAYPDMFYYLYNPCIPRTSNGLEGYFSHLKRLYRQHAGLRRHNLKNYLLWYVYLNNKQANIK